MPDIDIAKIGLTIKNKRLEKEFSIRDLAGKSGIAASTISQIETGKTSPNLLSLKAICDALEVPVFSLFMYEEDIGKVSLVRKNEQQSFVRNISNGKEMMESLIIGEKKEMWGGIINVPAQTNSGDYARHEGEEFVFVLQGEIKMDLENCQVYHLQEHDTLYYPNYIGHRWLNDSNEESRILIISTSPYKF